MATEGECAKPVKTKYKVNAGSFRHGQAVTPPSRRETLISLIQRIRNLSSFQGGNTCSAQF